ncbi:YjgB family protein [Alicyclobacillus acidoterrestris]|uniref:YjgB family protein n=1 Tax=Alicyclobacillus TaxID=29330 RepID=UPI001A8C9F46|nr:YjgB family protein [Alicyclobacillus suci]
MRKSPHWMAFVLGIALVSEVLVTGCASKTPQSSNTISGQSTAVNHTSNQTSNEPSGQTSNPTSSGTGASNPSTTSAMDSSSNTQATSTGTAQETVRNIVNSAVSGTAYGIPYKLQANLDDVVKAWGQPAQQNAAGAGIYASYPAHDAAFGLNKGDQLFDIRSFSSTVQAVTLSDIEDVLGKPGAIRETSDSQIYLYPAGPDYQLLWVFSKANGQISDHVDHISVFWPQGTVNSMAATQPAPGVVIDSKTGHRVTFSIANPPKSYRLVELEFIPNKGSSVVNTLSQATGGSQTPGFSLNSDGTTIDFHYNSNLVGESGIIRVIYQNDDGAAMIGNSATLTLK